MKTVFLRDYKQVINKHPKSWNLPCSLPRDLDCGEYINEASISKIDTSLHTIEWKVNNETYWTHFDEVYIVKPTKILGKTYIHNFKEV